jgi:hypothetical protein
LKLATADEEDQPQHNEVLRKAGKLWKNDIPSAMAYLESHGDFRDSDTAFAYLRWALACRQPGKFQAATTEAIQNLSRMSPQRSGKYLERLLHYAERACLELPLLDRLLEQTASQKTSDADIERTWGAVSRRQVHRRKLAPVVRGITVIPLGLNCLAWNLPNRWGFRCPADFDLCENPFSLAMHRLPAVIDALEQDFRSYAVEEDLISAVTPNGTSIAARRDRGAVWNHHQGTYWSQQGYVNLRRDLASKAENFRQSCRRDGLVFLMSNCPANSPAEVSFLPQLQSALARHTGRPDNFLILTNQRAATEGPTLNRVDDTTFLVRCPFPTKRYVWYDDDTADVSEGLSFEQRYSKLLLKCLARWGLIDDWRIGSGTVSASTHRH